LLGGGDTRIPRVLLATADEAARSILQVALKRDGLEVVAVAGEMDALSRIAAEHFDLLLSGLHMACAGDGFTIVSAMRHAHPQAVTVVLSGYPVQEEALSSVRLLADEILVRPIQIVSLRKLIYEEIAHSAASGLPSPESVATILEHDRDVTIQYWMELVEHDEELTCIPLSLEDRTGHLPNLIADLVNRLRLPHAAKANISATAREHGDLRRKQGYTAAMVVEESRILEVSIFNTLQNNLRRVDFSRVLLDVVTIADEVDSQLKQAMFSYVEPRPGPAWSAA
jgi:ActR/RegA family two-component response regulator